MIPTTQTFYPSKQIKKLLPIHSVVTTIGDIGNLEPDQTSYALSGYRNKRLHLYREFNLSVITIINWLITEFNIKPENFW